MRFIRRLVSEANKLIFFNSFLIPNIPRDEEDKLSIITRIKILLKMKGLIIYGESY